MCALDRGTKFKRVWENLCQCSTFNVETIFMHRVSNFDDREIDFKADSSDIHKIFATAYFMKKFLN